MVHPMISSSSQMPLPLLSTAHAPAQPHSALTTSFSVLGFMSSHVSPTKARAIVFDRPSHIVACHVVGATSRRLGNGQGVAVKLKGDGLRDAEKRNPKRRCDFSREHPCHCGDARQIGAVLAASEKGIGIRRHSVVVGRQRQANL